VGCGSGGGAGRQQWWVEGEDVEEGIERDISGWGGGNMHG
jgi:hypothetical protein